MGATAEFYPQDLLMALGFEHGIMGYFKVKVGTGGFMMIKAEACFTP